MANDNTNQNRPQSPLRLERLSHPQVADYLSVSDVAIVPCGATEQHGGHLPLGVDAMTAIAVAHDAADQEQVVVTPPLWFGWSPHHMGFPGTVSVRAETLTALATDVATSLIHHGFRRVIFVNGHRLANLPPLAVASTQVRAATGALVIIADLAHLAQPEYAHALEREGAGGIGHADGYETAQMMHLHPDLVHPEAITAPKPQGADHPTMRAIDPSYASSRVGWWPSTEAELVASGDGASGDPGWGTPERGAVLHGAMVRDLRTLIQQARTAPVQVHTPRASA